MSRRSVMLLGAALLAAACTDQTRDPVTPPSVSPTDAVDAVTRAIAQGMAQPAARAAVRNAMRASPLTEHKLSLREYATSAEGEALARAAAAATGTTLDEFRARVAALPDLDFYVPAEQQRLTWRGGTDYVVAASIGEQGARVAYDGDGRSRALDLTTELPSATVFLVQSAETKSVRIDRQRDVPGLTIQDPGDGQLSGSWMTIDRDGTTRSLYLADLVAADGPMRMQCLDCDGGGGGGGGGGGAQPPPPPLETYLERIITRGVCDNDNCSEGNEFEFRALLENGQTEVLRLEQIPSTGDLIKHMHLIWALPPMLVGGECDTSQFSCLIAARETDTDPFNVLNDDFWFFHYWDTHNLERCRAIPLGSNVGLPEPSPLEWRSGSATDNYRLFGLEEKRILSIDGGLQLRCASGQNALPETFRLMVSFSWPVIKASTVTVSPSALSVCLNGGGYLTATAKDQWGRTLTPGTVAWSSSNTSGATVASTGTRTATVIGLAVGQATITATLDGVSGTSSVTVGTCLPTPTSCLIEYIPTPKYLKVSWANADPAASTEVEINKNGVWTSAGTAAPGVTQSFYTPGTTGLFYGRVRHVRTGYLPSGYCTTGSTTAP